MKSSSSPFHHRNALVIGGTSGIGRSAACALADQGANVIVIGKPDDTSQIEACFLKQIYTDMTSRKECRAAFDQILDLFLYRLDIVVHTVGGSARSMGDGPLVDCTEAGWHAALRLNLDSAFHSVQAAVTQMQTQTPDGSGQRGSIVVVGSVLADHPSVQFFNTIGYAVAKAGLEALVKNAAAAHALDGIRVNMLKPGLVHTPMANRAISKPEIAFYLQKKQPLTQGPISADACAKAILALVDPGIAGLTGAIMTLDGGWSLTDPFS